MMSDYNTAEADLAPELVPAAEALRQLGKGPRECVAIVSRVTDGRESQQEVFSIKEAVQPRELALADAIERVMLSFAVQKAALQIDSLPLHSGVLRIMRKEFQAYVKAPGPKPALIAGTDPFVTACKIATLRRFTAGPMDWGRSGVPRSYMLRLGPSRVPAALRFLLKECGGYKPMFYIHLAPAPRNRALVIPAEVHRAYYRIARSLELQPEVRGVACASWFHDPEIVRQTPHLAPLNAPYLEWGGKILGTIGDAPPGSGFLDYNPERRKLYQEGKLRPKLALAIWPRRAAIEWAGQHPQLDR